MRVAFFYSLSSAPLLYPRQREELPQIEWLTHSIESLKKHVANPEIYICYTPPHDEEDEKKLETFGTLIKRDNIIQKKRQNAFTAHADRVVNRAYAHLIDDVDVLFSVDTDIIFKDDPLKILDDEHDIYGVLGERRYKFISIRFLIIREPFYRLCNQRWVEKYTNNKNQLAGGHEVCLLQSFLEYDCKIKHIPKNNRWFVHRPKLGGT